MQALAAPRSTGTSVGSSTGHWDAARWVKILDRIEHRQPDVGLRFWGPPLWLEVTMVGPDSDLWPAIDQEARAWDWQSSAPCAEVDALAEQGADDDRLLAVVGRYTIENLILNAVHEIGEWFRFDGRRLFPAHDPGNGGLFDRDDQGNGSVCLQLRFGSTHRFAGDGAAPAPDEKAGRHLVSRLTDAAGPSRFTYLPGTSILFEPAGPVIQRSSDGEPPSTWQSTWSASTLEAAGADDRQVTALIGRDVHRALVTHEADRVCRAFHIDGSRPWRLDRFDSGVGSDSPDAETDGAEKLSFLIEYAGESGVEASARTSTLRSTRSL